MEEDSDEMSDNELDTISFGNWRDMLYANAVDLGFLDELICRSSSCQLCALIIDTATRINHGEELPTKDKGERIKYLLQKDLFCMLCNVLYGGKFRGRLDIKPSQGDIRSLDTFTCIEELGKGHVSAV